MSYIPPETVAGRAGASSQVAEPSFIAAAPASSPPALALPPQQRRWSFSAWAFVREGGTAALAPGGTLGGSQAGLRATYRLTGHERPLAASLRLSSPLQRPQGAEVAAGLDWKPLASVPAHILLERRQKLGPEGRSAFSLTLYGGFGEAKAGPFRIDGYGEAGLVGTKSRDGFADGAIRAALPLDRWDRLRIGAGVWAAAQPRVSRLDVGPHAEIRLPLAGHGASLSADWRFRVAGNARPGSGPALTLAADF